MTQKTRTIVWQEGAFGGSPAVDDNGNRLIVVPVADSRFTAGYPCYVPDDDDSAAKSAIDIQASLGAPA